MTALWISTAVLTVLALAALLLPMSLGKRKDVSPARADFDLTVYKDQLTEIDKDMERGVLSEDQATAARTEIERRMLAVAGEGDEEIKNTPVPQWLMLTILVTVPVGAFAMYFGLGQPSMQDRPFAERAATPQMADVETRKAQIAKMIEAIKGRIKQEPDNPQHWAMLGQATQMAGMHAQSVQAYEQLVAITNRNPEALMVLAEAMFIEAGEVVTPAAVTLFKEAKSVMPQNPMTYYYLAMERQVAGDSQAAMDEYEGLLSISPSNGKWVPTIQARMKALGDKSGITVPDVKMLPPMVEQAAAPESAPTPGPTRQQIEDAQGMAADDQNAMILTMVNRLADKLKENPDDLEGWKRLANAYKVLGDEAKMNEALAQVKRLEAP